MMRRFAFAVFGLGLAALVWVGWGYAGVSPLALGMTVLIGAVYLAGALELWRFHQASTGLQAALADPPGPDGALDDWLARLPAALQPAVRLRIEGERGALPGPSLTPYLVGLLVLLGMLGTFLGMVVTLKGAVLALETTTDLPTIRAALAAPVRGLGLAFGTSVAGVAASALLGLLSALCRRQRQQVARALDRAIATGLHRFSRARQRQALLDAVQDQARLVPAVVDQVQALMARLDAQQLALMARVDAQQQALGERLAGGQDRFHRDTGAALAALGASMDRSLQQGLADAARLAGATLQPLVEASLAGLSRDSAAFQQQLLAAAQARLDTVAGRLDGAARTVAEGWAQALTRHEASSQAVTQGLQAALAGFAVQFAQRSDTLLAAVDARQAAQQRDSAATLGAAVDALGRQASALLAGMDRAQAAQREALVAQEQQRLADSAAAQAATQAAWRQDAQQAGAQALAQQQQILQALEQTAQRLQAEAQAQARGTVAEVARLVDAASQAPQAAAELVGQLRQQLSDSLARDTEQLAERSRIMATLGGLLASVEQAATGQRQAIDALVSSAATLLGQAGARLNEAADTQSGQLAALAAQMSGSAVEVASLGEAFGSAVQQFSNASETLLLQLQRIEGTLGHTSARSDEQLAYYVAQAREIIDLSLSSQQQIVADLQGLARRPAPLVSEGA